MARTRVGLRVALAAIVSLGSMFVWSPVASAGSLDTTNVSCTWPSATPQLSASKQLTGTVDFTCTNKTTSSQIVTLRVTVFEYQSNRTTFNYMSFNYSRSVQVTIPARTTQTFRLPTNARTCVSQETGRDDYGIESAVSYLRTTSKFDQKWVVDGYDC